jgi:hypothetical protein
MRTIVLSFALIVALAGPAAAQATEPGRFSFGATGGFGQTWDDEGSIGKGWLAGGYAGVRIFRRTDVEFAVDWLQHDRSGGAFLAEGHTTFLSAALVQRFGSDRTNGYVLGGLTAGIHDGTVGFAFDGPLHKTSGTHGGFVFGGGLSFPAGPVDIGPIVRIVLLGADTDSDPASAIMAGVRIGLRK